MTTTYREKADKTAHVIVQVACCNCGGWAMPAASTKLKATEKTGLAQPSKEALQATQRSRADTFDRE